MGDKPFEVGELVRYKSGSHSDVTIRVTGYEWEDGFENILLELTRADGKRASGWANWKILERVPSEPRRIDKLPRF